MTLRTASTACTTGRFPASQPSGPAESSVPKIIPGDRHVRDINSASLDANLSPIITSMFTLDPRGLEENHNYEVLVPFLVSAAVSFIYLHLLFYDV